MKEKSPDEQLFLTRKQNAFIECIVEGCVESREGNSQDLARVIIGYYYCRALLATA